MSKCCWGHEDCPIPRTEKAVKEFTHTHDGETCAPHCYGCFIQNEALADAMALRAEVERLKYFELNVEQNERAYNESQEEVRRLNLQNGDMKKTLMWIRQNHPHVWFPPSTPSDKCSVCIAIDNALALKPLPVEGQPGEVCGPCGVAHPVVEKPKQDCTQCRVVNGLHEAGCCFEKRVDDDEAMRG